MYKQIKIGTVTIEAGDVRRKLYECAAWFRDIELKPGVYDLYGQFQGDYLQWITYSAPGTIKAESFDSLYCGNLIKAHRDEHVGEAESYYFQGYPYTTVAEFFDQFSLSSDWQIVAEQHSYSDGRSYTAYSIKPAVKAETTDADD